MFLFFFPSVKCVTAVTALCFPVGKFRGAYVHPHVCWEWCVPRPRFSGRLAPGPGQSSSATCWHTKAGGGEPGGVIGAPGIGSADGGGKRESSASVYHAVNECEY